jgi:hypothetical protein
MKWPLKSMVPFRETPLYNRYYLHAPTSSSADPILMMGTEFDAEALLTYLQTLNRNGTVVVTAAHALVRATALGLAQFPDMNVRIVGRKIYRFKTISVRMAFFHRQAREIDVLIVSSADTKSVQEIAREVWQRLLQAGRGEGSRDRDLARMRRVPAFGLRQLLRFYNFLDRRFPMPAVSRLDELRGGSAMVNDLSHLAPPLRTYKPSRFPDDSDSINVTLGPVETKVVMRSEKVLSARIMPLFLRADHRLVDAYQMGRYLAAVRALLEHPEKLTLASESTAQAAQ